METEHKNKLVQYRGGGYSGCFWEWNFFFIDIKGKFHDVFSSGSAGITMAEQAAKLLKDIPNEPHIYAYDVTTEAAWLEINKENAKDNIQTLVAWFNDYDTMQVKGIKAFAVCDVCDCHIDCADEIRLENFQGCGGLMIKANDLICAECHCSLTCESCQEYIGSDGLREVSEAVQDEIGQGIEYACEGCIECAEDEVERKEHTDSLWSCLTTGTPDLFSPDMNWYWGLV